MRTKHVLMTTALLSLFAACTNDDFVSYEQGAQSGDAALRPSVDVTLNVSEGNGADTRLTFIPGEDEGYLWETNDTIGALLMDKVIAEQNGEAIRPHDDIEKWEEMAWTSRYQLVDYINTNYPFVRQADGRAATARPSTASANRCRTARPPLPCKRLTPKTSSSSAMHASMPARKVAT